MASSRARGRVDVYELAAQRSVLHLEVPLAVLPRLAPVLLDTEGNLRCTFAGRQGERGPAADLAVEGTVRLRCDRCGEPVEVAISERAAFFFVDDEAEMERLPVDELPEEPLIGSREFDLSALVEDQAILALPISPRHADCELPGAAQRDKAESRRPFDVLAALKPRRH